jgi:DNA-binding response OmpR family regulator
MGNQTASGEPLTVLLVEDNLAHAEMVKRSFEDHRVANKIIHVTDGEMALDYMLRRDQYADPQSSPRPHVVLLDLRLPKIDGLQVLKEIRSTEEISRSLVVILSTSAAETDVARAYEYHANSYLVKPVDFMKFTEMMDDLGFYWLGWNYFPWGEGR